MEDQLYKPTTIGDWIITMLLMTIPLVNIILIFIWAFGQNTPVSKANLAKAILLWVAIALICSAAFVILSFLGLVGIASL